MKVKVLIPSIKTAEELQSQIDTINETTGGEVDVLPICGDASAAANRNRALRCLEEKDNIFIMMDDDITNFYQGWHVDLLKPMTENESIIICSARLRSKNGAFQNAMGMNELPFLPVLQLAQGKLITTACIAIRKNEIIFDQGFIGSGFEDTDYSKQIGQKYPDQQIVVNNSCILTHLNEAKNQGGAMWEMNRNYYIQKWPEDGERV